GETAARELLLTGALRDANWALRHHFISEVVAPEALDDRIADWAAGVERGARVRGAVRLAGRPDRPSGLREPGPLTAATMLPGGARAVHHRPRHPVPV